MESPAARVPGTASGTAISKADLNSIWVNALFLAIEDYDPEKLSDFPVWKNICH